MKITRRFTKEGTDPFATTEWTTRSSRITNPDGSVVFEMPDAEVPVGFSQLATDIMVSKYFRKAGVPQFEDKYGLPGNTETVKNDDGSVKTGPERSARQVIHRLAGCWRHWGETHGYFDTPRANRQHPERTRRRGVAVATDDGLARHAKVFHMHRVANAVTGA